MGVVELQSSPATLMKEQRSSLLRENNAAMQEDEVAETLGNNERERVRSVRVKHAFEQEEESPWFLKVVYVSVPVS